MVVFKCAVTNTSLTPTLNVNGTGAKNIVKRNALVLAAGDIIGGGIYIVIYNGATWNLINPTAP